MFVIFIPQIVINMSVFQNTEDQDTGIYIKFCMVLKHGLLL